MLDGGRTVARDHLGPVRRRGLSAPGQTRGGSGGRAGRRSFGGPYGRAPRPVRPRVPRGAHPARTPSPTVEEMDGC